MMAARKGAFNIAADTWNAAKRILKQVPAFFYRIRVRLVAGSIGENLKVNGQTKVTRNTHIGNNCNFNGLVVEGRGKVTIGDYFHSGREVLIMSQRHDFEGADSIPYGEEYVLEDVNIESFVWLGTRVTVLGGVTIGEGAIIQAGSVVVLDIPRCAIAGGHPAEVFKSRDIDRFESLKAEGKYH